VLSLFLRAALVGPLDEKQKHGNRRIGNDGMWQTGLHLNPRPGASFLFLAAQPEAGFTIQEVENSRQRRSMLGKLLAFGEVKEDGFDTLGFIECTALDTVWWDFRSQPGQRGKEDVIAHGLPLKTVMSGKFTVHSLQFTATSYKLMDGEHS
jgi:hypothetical protein